MSRFPLFPGCLMANFKSQLGKGERFPGINGTPHLLFMDDGGKIRAGCCFGELDPRPLIAFDLGLVPDDVVAQGRDAITAYTEEKLHALIDAEQTRRRECEERIQGLNRQYELQHNGVTIRGFVTKGEHRGPRADFMNLTMTEPFRLAAQLYVRPQCFADGMSGTRSFDVDGNLLDQEIQRQQNTLVQMYKQEASRQKKRPAHPALAMLENVVSCDPEYYEDA